LKPFAAVISASWILMQILTKAPARAASAAEIAVQARRSFFAITFANRR
jgi:hypothetical protein